MRRKIILQFIVGNGVLVSNMLLTIILSRILSPDEIGVFSIAAVLVSIAHVFRDFGVGSYLKHVKEVTPQLLRSAFGLLLFTSWIVAVGLYFSAKLWGTFFNDVRVAEVVEILALGFLFIPFGSIPEAIMVREAAVWPMAKAAVVTVVFYFSVSVILAFSGYSYTTMAWANLSNIIVSGLAYRYFLGRPIPWLPSYLGWRRIADFGLGSIITSLLKVVDSSLPDLILGKYSNATSVGLYSRANATVNLVGVGITPTINFFALPYLSKLHHGNTGLQEEFLRIGSIINGLLLPPLIFIAVMAPEIVHTLYGPQWIGSVPAIPWICAAVGVSTLFTLTIPALQGVGKPYAFALPLLLTLFAKGMAIYYCFDGSISSFARGILLGQMGLIPIYVYVAKKYLGVPILSWLHDIWQHCLISAISGGCVFIFKNYFWFEFVPVVKLGASIAVFLVIFMPLLFLSALPLKDEVRKLFSEIWFRLKFLRD